MGLDLRIARELGEARKKHPLAIGGHWRLEAGLMRSFPAARAVSFDEEAADGAGLFGPIEAGLVGDVGEEEFGVFGENGVGAAGEDGSDAGGGVMEVFGKAGGFDEDGALKDAAESLADVGAVQGAGASHGGVVGIVKVEVEFRKAVGIGGSGAKGF
jgi:hypothetical protein